MTKAQQLIETLNLKRHPEGGFYRETYRSPLSFMPSGVAEPRNLVTLIYFMLTTLEFSKFHRIFYDEIWMFHDGAPIHIHLIDKEGALTTKKLGKRTEEGELPQILIPGNTLFGAELGTGDDFGLASCMVAPGFDFRDFELFTAEEMNHLFPRHTALFSRIYKLK